MNHAGDAAVPAKGSLYSRGVAVLAAMSCVLALLAATACRNGDTAGTDRGIDAAGTIGSGEDWTGYGGDVSESRYSRLDQIDDGNVQQLGLAWSYDIDVRPNAFSAPLAIDGVLYFGVGYSVVHAMDARTGRLLWKYDPEAQEASGERMRAAWGIRGIAHDAGRIYTGTIDGRLIALDAASGEELWSVQTLEPEDGRYISGAPWVFDGKVAIGHGGADFAPVRGYVTVYDGDTGEQLWRFHTVPGNPDDGFENAAMEMAADTWTGEWWKFGGGGTVWNAMAYDPEFNRLYIGTGNGAPWNQKIRSPDGGDNLFLCSVIALDADTGEYVWHYQINPGETWDYNAAMDMHLAELDVDGRARKVLMTAPKNGFFYVIDREDGRLLSAEKFVRNVTWAERIDLATGRPVEHPEARYPGGRPAVVFPSPVGAHSVEASAYSPRTGLVYIPAIEQGRVYIDAEGDLSRWQFTPGQMINTGTGRAPPEITVPPGGNSLLAWDPVAQKAAWSVPLTGSKNGAILATAGNLVFQGNVEGELAAYAADSGRKLWSFDAGNGVMAQPISYAVDGVQYVTVLSGWRLSGPSGASHDWDYYAQKRRVLTFKLDGGASLPPADRTPLPFLDLEDLAIDDRKAALGAQIYAQRCTICHGPNLRSGGAAPDLRKAGMPLAVETLRAVLHDGVLVGNGMPRYAELGQDEIEGLHHYVRQQARMAIAQQAQTP
ncbi:PQQ-dependent dehydrogenase, methanol/ethanol family [Luteimonas saliphila]|uniref:PQQ-dependent dehydrogenase, methanol/ethanol family n=1 Tax=Luteimonas saliphila TaxID=2804919 RepID=UPI00192D7360|nr:PQQ-dependent dehydrogenase, methanol/ethanol family [Luteimonas saliphila]